MTTHFAEIAAELIVARHAAHQISATKCAAIGDQAAGYAVQQHVVSDIHDRLVGWKIGATNAVSQNMLGTDRPFYGPLFDRWCYPSGVVQQIQPGLIGVEVEIAFRLGRDLPRRSAGYGEVEIAAAVASAHPVIELVGTRFALDGLAPAPVTIADFGGNSGFVHGNAFDGWPDLDLLTIEARCIVDGAEQARDLASVVFGGPLKSLAWLADHGPGLRQGQFVSTGTITGLTRVPTGGSVVGDFGALGEVRMQLLV